MSNLGGTSDGVSRQLFDLHSVTSRLRMVAVVEEAL
jgi:hypothetical protein